MRLLPLLLIVSSTFGHSFMQASTAVAMESSGRSSELAAGLAQAQALDRKCGFLSPAEHDRLSDLVAEAEIGIAQALSVAGAQKALAEGRSAAARIPCDEQSRKVVAGVLANQAQEVTYEVNEPAPEPEQDAELAITLASIPASEALENARKPLESAPVQSFAAATGKAYGKARNDGVQKATARGKAIDLGLGPKPKATGRDLNQYATLAEEYYMARRCQTLGKSAMRQLYSQVLSFHKRAMASNQPEAVRSTLQTAEMRARIQPCSN